MFKVSFIDKLEDLSENQSLTKVHFVLSFKKYNSMNTFDPMETENGASSSHCCTVF